MGDKAMPLGRSISTLMPLALFAGVLAIVPAVLGGARKMVEPLGEGYAGSYGERSARHDSGARKAVADAQFDVAMQRRKLHRTHLDLERQTRNSGGWVEALLDAREARTQVESIRTPILATLSQTPEIQGKQIEISHLEAELETAREAGKSKRVVEIAKKLMAVRAEVRRMQADAMEDNEDLTFAMEDLVDAGDRMRELWRSHELTLKSDPNLTQARVALASAEQRKREAHKQLAREQRENVKQERNRLEGVVRASLSD